MTNASTLSRGQRQIPPDVDEKTFERALSAFRKAIGDGWVLSNPEDLQKFHEVKGDERFVPSAVLSLGSVEEVQAIVRIANETGVPLSPISTGKNNGYGGASPRLSGAVVVNLGQRMNRILEVNEKFGYALVEPGVTYFDLHNHLQKTNSCLMLDCPDLGWGSVVGNTMDRGVGYTPWRPFSLADRNGGCASQGRLDAYRHGRRARQQYVATLPLWVRPLP
jgi:4-cresol dehydrogenase (hydroxylating)